MTKKWKAVRVRQELVKKVEKELEKSQYQSLSEFVSEAIRLRMQTLAKERVSKYLERDRNSRITQLQAKRFYTPKHIWVFSTPQGTVRIGITDYFQGQLKEVANIITSKTGEEVSKDEPFGVVETWWFTHDLYSPINGRIVSVNAAVINNPFLLNADPHQWIIEVQPTHANLHSWTHGLLSLGEYKKLVTKLED
ncbi:MAG: hypothetical protein PVF15_03730 [Candidatus Bathyarchaeota archaeon]|jgi:glycine cleavage system H protein